MSTNATQNQGHNEQPAAPTWYGWGSPIGLGIALTGAGGCWVLFTLGLNVLANTPY